MLYDKDKPGDQALRVADDMAGVLRRAGASPEKAITVKADILAAWERSLRTAAHTAAIEAEAAPVSRVARLVPILAVIQGGAA